MKLLHIQIPTCAILASLLASTLGAFEPKINLTIRKELVLEIEKRQTVLELGSQYLEDKTVKFSAEIEALDDPFAFEVEESDVVTQVAGNNNTDNKKPLKPEAIRYSDAEVLAASASSFAKKVRGAIVRGKTSFLQLEGGTLLKPGTSFPVRMPKAEKDAYMLTIDEVTSEGYTLKVGEATQHLNFGDTFKSSSGSIQFSKP